MNLPFLRYFKKDKAGQGSVAVAATPVSTIEKPASERLGKTVMPHSSRIVGLEPGGNFPIPASAPAATAPARKISLGSSGSVAVGPKPSAVAPAAERTIALPLADLVPNIPGDMLKPAPVDPERRIILKASEVERGMATGRPTALLRAIYKQAPEFFTTEVSGADLQEVALPFDKVVAQFASFQVRDDQITEQECPQLETPFLQVTLEDNERFGQTETPAPAVKPAAAGEAKPAVSPEPKLKVAPEAKPPAVTAPEVPAATPAPAPAAPKPIAPIRFSAPPPPPASAPVPAPATETPLPLDQSPPSPPSPEQLSPNGTGAPAAERVPASSGSPVPTPLPSPLAPSSPTRIPFKVTAPSNDLRKDTKFPAPAAGQEAAQSAAGPRISLPLRNILRNLAPFQLTGSIEAVPETAQIEIPFAIVKPQLSLGRVAISPAQFQEALPDEHRALFKADPAGTPVPLTLQDVLQNLPSESLQLRGDQEEPEIAEAFETPFSKKAMEDAARMKVPASPGSRTGAPPAAEAGPSSSPAAPETAAPKIAPPESKKPAQPAPVSTAPPAKAPVESVSKTPPKSAKESPVEAAKAAPIKLAKDAPRPAPAAKDKPAPAAQPPSAAPKAAASPRRSALQQVLETDEPLDAKSVANHVSRFPGVSSCAIVFSDGLSLAGNVPAEYEADALCAMAPSIMQRIGEQMAGAKFGALRGLTLFCAKTPVSLFAHDNICLAVIHSGGELAAETRDRLGRITQGLARMYSEQPNA